MAKLHHIIRFVSLLVLLVLVMTTPVVTQAQDVTYVNANGEDATLADGSYTLLTNQTELTDGWWVVDGEVNYGNRITINGVVHLVLLDGATLNAGNGIFVDSNKELHIYAQSGDNATLNATATRDNEAGIGGNIHGTAGLIEVNGGHVIAKGGKYAAGIGGGGNGYWSGKYGNAGTFIINGGHVEATGGDNGGAGIGGGGYTSANSITGGDGGIVTINGGIVEARGGKDGYGVGPGTSGWNTGHDGNSASLSLGWRNPSDYIYMSTVKANVTVTNVFFFENGEQVTAESDLNGRTIYPYDGEVRNVVFMVDGELYAKRTVAYGYTVAEPARPVKNGKIFEYWYASDATQAYDFSAPVTTDLTLNARFRDFLIQTDESGNYLIGSEADWSEFAQIVAETPSANAKLTADVQLSALSPMLGSDQVKYAGTFDGQGHTLTVAYNTTQDMTAPFRFTNGATISNLTVDGTISTSAKYAAGIIAHAYGNTSLNNCVSKVAISSTVSGDGTHGGLVALVENTTSLTNCVFAGKLLGSSTNSCGGLVGWKGGSVTFTDCLFIPQEITINTAGCHTFSRNTPSSLVRCYYTEALGETGSALFVAQLLEGEGVTLTGTPNASYDGKSYYTPGSTVSLDYALPDGKFFDHYEVSNGEISESYKMTGDHVLSGFTTDVTITGSHADEQISLFEQATILPIADVVYNKSAQQPEVIVKVGDKVLTEGVNYTLEWADNTNVGQAMVTVTGVGLYYGSLSARFNILQRSVADAEIKADYISKYGVNGSLIHPELVLTYGDYELKLDTDYTLSYSEGCVEPGDYTITVEGKGNYNGSRELPFTIYGEVTYLDYNEGTFIEATRDNYSVITPDRTVLDAGWWVVNSDTRVDQPITVKGDVHLILADGVKFTASKGIRVNYSDSEPNNLTIYAQSDGEGMGSLIVNDPASGCAGIGGENGKSHGTITINGGAFTVKGNSSAGIGSGQDAYSMSDGSYIYIHGGDINATGGSWSAGVGGGDYGGGGHIIITGGKLTAHGGSNSGGAGIGGSDGYSALEINISGGIVNAIGGGNSPGIGGGGSWSSSGTGGRSGAITISGGQVTAQPGNACLNAIGNAYNAGSTSLNDYIKLGWSDAANDYINVAGNYASGTVSFSKAFAIKSTSTLATTDNIANAMIRPAGIISIGSNIENGTIVADKDVCNFYAGDRQVTLTVTPIENYRLESISVTLAQGGSAAQGEPPMKSAGVEIPVTKVDESTYTFEMPDGDVMVNATFVQEVLTSIDRIDADRDNSVRYNINGQRVSGDYRGIVIENGKKRVVR
ncbi:MAG: InlB B-repeat-containing protein [Bacteroidales bacterium]|nr:InlB B-repeat-containing protein [Bacteroidales bacterium]